MDRTTRPWAALAGLNGLMSVAAGAFAAHAVQDPHARDLLHTGASYQLAHAVAGLVCVALAPSLPVARSSAGLFGAGALLFGGSLYLLAATGVSLFGAVTPLGGLLLLAGWAALVWGALRPR